MPKISSFWYHDQMKKAKVMKFLIFGDVFGSLGRKLIADQLPALKKRHKPDLVIANAENLTHGSGTSLKALADLQLAGVDLFTGGNHTFDNQKIEEVFSQPDSPAIRPANWTGVSGKGFKVIEKDGHKILLINLIGRLFMNPEFDNPFLVAEKMMAEEDKSSFSAIVVDFHAEATSETAAMGHFFDGWASLVFGTHSHVATADERILPKGTGFISDVGMTGPLDSVIGMQPDGVVEKFLHPERKVKIAIEESGPGIVNAIIVEVDSKSRKCISIKRISLVTK